MIKLKLNIKYKMLNNHPIIPMNINKISSS